MIQLYREGFLQAIQDAQTPAPSPYTDIYCQTVLPTWGNQNFADHEEEFMRIFGCPNGPNGETMNCRDDFARFFNSATWFCNTQYYWGEADLDAFSYGKESFFISSSYISTFINYH